MEKKYYSHRGSFYDSVGNIANFFAYHDYSAEQIAAKIGNLGVRTRALLHLSALMNGNDETAEKIKKANEIIDNRIIEQFKDAVKNGDVEVFLSNMSEDDKISLEVNMNLSRTGLDDLPPLTEEEQIYYNIIEKSINDELKRKATLAGFNSIEEWQQYNRSLIANSFDLKDSATKGNIIICDEIDYGEGRLKR